MPTPERIRELCDRVIAAEGEKFELIVLELNNAIDIYTQTREVNGDHAAKSGPATGNHFG